MSVVVGAVIVLIAVVLLSVWLFVNPNNYKGKIQALVKEHTGRDLVLQGDIKLSVFPWIALELGPASLGNPPGFGDSPFVLFRHASVRAKLLPLLQERLEVGRIEIDGLDARLFRNAAGKGNWEGFGKPEAAAQAGEKPPGVATPGGNPLESIAGIKITNSRFSYDQYVVENFTLETASSSNGQVPVSMKFTANRGIPTENATVDGKVDFSNPTGTHYRLTAFALNGVVNLAGGNRPIRWNISMPSVDADLDGQTLGVPAFALSLAGAQLNGSLAATQIIDDPSASGALALAPLVLREFMPRLTLTAPKTADPRALSSVAASMKFVYGSNAVTLSPLEFTLDDTHLKGDFAVENLTTMAMKFALRVDAIDLDRYLPPPGGPEAAAKPAAPAARAGAEPSKSLEANGTFAVGSLHVSRLDMTDLHLTLAAKDGVMHVFPLTAAIDGGNYSGDITLDSRGTVPILSMDEHLSGVDMARLAATQAKNLHVSGKGNVNIKASGHGAAADALLGTLNGHFDTYVTGGGVEGVDLGYQLGRAEALLKRTTYTGQDTNHTQFDALKMSAEIVNGVATTKDLTMSSQILKVTGQGSTNLVTNALDFSLLADLLRSAGGVPLQIPVKVTGTTASPTIRPDIAALATGQIKQRVQDLVHDKLKGLFGKP